MGQRGEVAVAVDEEKKKKRRIIDVNLIYELLDTVDILILPRPFALFLSAAQWPKRNSPGAAPTHSTIPNVKVKSKSGSLFRGAALWETLS